MGLDRKSNGIEDIQCHRGDHAANMNYAWNALLSIFSFFLPFSGQPKEDTTFELDMALIDGARVRGGDEQLLEEARRLRDIENARSLRATASAQFYLGGLIALLPLLFSLDF